MAFNFEDLTKIPGEPAARLLANSGMKLETKLDLPTVASVSEYLTALDDLGETIDILRLLAVALPPREAVWWACIAGTDIAGDDEESATPSLSAAKAWVYKPDDDSREAVRVAMQNADHDDETVFCALAAFYADGTAGLGDMKEQPAPPAAVPASVLAQNIAVMGASDDDVEGTVDLLIRRALDIARGGNGKVEAAKPAPVTEEEE